MMGRFAKLGLEEVTRVDDYSTLVLKKVVSELVGR